MNIVAVDNSAADLSQIADCIIAVSPDSEIQRFTDPLLAAKHICNHRVDVAFLMDEMRPANGFKLMRVLRQNAPELAIVMLSESDANRTDAMRAGFDDYLVKPVTTEQLSAAISQLTGPRTCNKNEWDPKMKAGGKRT